jgi:N-acetylmuramoyl-L-alanine amidase
MPKSLLQSFLAACALLVSVSVMAQTVTDVPLSDADVKIKSAAQNATQSTAQNAAQSTASEAAKKLPTAEEIAAERARLERMRAALAAERAALEQYKADLVKRQQEAAAAEAKAKADAEAKAKIEKAIAEKAVGSAGSVPPPAKDDPVSIKNMSPEELQRQRQLAIARAKAIEKAVAAQKAADAKKKAAAAASTPQTTSPKDKDVATMKLRRITQNKVRYVHLRDVAVNYGLTFAYTKNKANKVSGAVIYDKTRKAVFSATYRDGIVNGVQVYFLYPMLIKNSEPYISEVDFLTCLDPLLRYKTPVKLGMKTIMIDAGHGGSDPGAINGAHKEKVYTLQIAKRLQTQLEKLGFRVIMTRTGDTYPTLQERAALCKKYKPDLFISIHCNSSTNKTPAGIETYRAVPVGGTETKGSKVKTEKQSANEFDANNSRLAYEIQKGMLAATGGTDRGTRHQAIYVTGNATCPAVLVEVGYLSNEAEVKKIASPDYQNKIVSGILAGLAGYGSFLR